MTRHNDERTITAGMTMASIAAGTTMAATAIAGHKKHSMDKHGRGTSRAAAVKGLEVEEQII
jgi:hypothetical protein